MICIYHSRDLDGWMSAAIVKLRYPDVKLHGYDYGDVFIDIPDEKVIMVDISFPKEMMREMGYHHSMTWIDHHISAIKDSEEMAYSSYTGLRDPKFAACELTWKYFFPDQPMPEPVRLLGRYDCFGHKGTDEEFPVLWYQYYARTFFTSPDDCIRLAKDDENIEAGMEIGRSIYRYLCTEAKQIYARRFPIKFGDYNFACVNQDRFNPVNFGIDYHKDGYDGFACFWYNKPKDLRGIWTFSLYNDNELVDCSAICKAEGGGGHKGAAGFTKDDINWLFQHMI